MCLPLRDRYLLNYVLIYESAKVAQSYSNKHSLDIEE